VTILKRSDPRRDCLKAYRADPPTSRPGRPLLERSGPSVLCALRFFAVTVTEHGHALDAKHSRTIENMELQSLLVYDMKN